MVYSSDSSEIETCQDGGLELQYNSVNTLEGLKRVYYQSWFICLAATPMCGISAARRINTLFLQRWDNNTDSAHNIPETFLKLLRNMVVTLIEQVPHTHGGQRTMVNLILELQKIPQEEGRRVNSNRGLFLTMRKESCVLNSCMKEHFRYHGISGRFVDTRKVESWTNLHAFTATQFGQGLMHWRYIGIMIFCDTLEQNSTGKNQEANIQAMAQWVRHAGETMFLTLRQREPISNLDGVDTTGELYSGEAGFCPERWSFWIKQDFKLAQVAPEHLKPLLLSSAHRMVDILVLGAASLMKKQAVG